MAIYDNVKELVIDAAETSLNASAEFDYTPVPVVLPAIPFVATLSGSLPDYPTYDPTAPPRENLSGSLSRSSYNAVSAVVGSLEVANLPSVLGFLTPVRPDPLPDHGTPDSPGIAPETGFISVEDSAGLEVVPAPVIVVGIPPGLEPIPLLSFDSEGFDLLDVAIPVPSDVPELPQLANPEELVVTVEPQLLAAIQHTLSGQDIMDVQHNLYSLATIDQTRERIDTERNLFAASGAAGFSDSNGPLAEEIADLNYKTRLADGESYEEGRDFLYDAAKKKLVEAVTQAIGLETANFAVHLSYASKLVEVFEINAALYTQIFNIIIDMYSTQLQAVNAVIGAYNTYIGAVLAEQSAEIATLSVARAQLKTNQALIDMYSSQAQTANVRVDVFETEVNQSILPIEEFTTYIDGLLQNVDIQQHNIRGYKDALGAYADATKIDKAKIDGYGAQIRAEGSAVDVYKENWDLYGTAHSALSGQSGAVAAFNRSSLQALVAEIGVFKEAASKQRSYLGATSAWLAQKKVIVGEYERGVSQYVAYTTRMNKAQIDIDDASNRVLLSAADVDSTNTALGAQQDAAQATIDAGLLASQATTYAGLAQASYAIRSVSASLRATSSDADGRTFSSTATEGRSYQRSYTYTRNL